jgi:hypothetical protein
VRRWYWTLVLVGIAIAIVVVATLALTADDDGGGTTSDGTTETTIASNPEGRDREDPNESGCAETGTNAARAELKDATGETVGVLTLRHSSACQTAWGRLVLERPQRMPVHVDVIRPADEERARFRYTGPERVVFGNMLEQELGCVYAEAYVGDEPEPAARARTRCLGPTGAAE